MVPLHILAGLLALVSGAVAFATYKGGRLHSRSGLAFAGAMIVMATSGATVAVLRQNAFSHLNEIAANLTAYLVITGYLSVQRRTPLAPWIDLLTCAAAFVLAFWAYAIGAQAIGQHGAPAPAFFMFGTLALLGGSGDARKWRFGIVGSRRIARHLWRMGTAFLIATSSFFLGQARVFPEPLRKPALLAVPVLLAVSALLYWLVRVRLTPTHPRVRRFAQLRS